MGKRRGRRVAAAKEPQIPSAAADEIDENGEEEEEKGSGFFACYLLTSLSPRFKGHTYIGYTVNPRRRIRQHNGEIGSGAFRTKRKRPWEMVLCIYGFPTNVAALQFEWAWQHPVESLAVRKAAATFKSLNGLANKIKLAYTMLTLPPWQSLNLRVNLFSTKYRHYTSGCPALPEQMQTQVCSMDDLPCYNADSCMNDELDDIERECSFQKSNDKESAGVVGEEEVDDSPNFYHNSEEYFNQQIDHRDGSGTNLESSGYLASTWIGSQSEPSPIGEEGQGRFCIDEDWSSRLDEDTWSDEQLLNKLPATASRLDADASLPMTKSPETSSREVEIIDIFTPSPCYIENSGSKKKRRRPNMCPEVIDLTNSPIFV